MAVKGLASPVADGRGARIGVARCDLDVAEWDTGVDRGHDECCPQHVRVHVAESGSLAGRPPLARPRWLTSSPWSCAAGAAMIDRWDLRIFVSAAFEETLARARIRDLAQLGSAARVEQRFRNRYQPSQQHYFDTVRPTDLAVHNDEPGRPAWEVRPR